MGLDMNYEAEVFVDTENLSREDWLACRRKGIGGSDAAAIMGMSPFCTKRDLYYDKCGIQAVMDEEEDNWVAKEVGHRLEDLVAEIFSKKTGLKVYPVRKMFRHTLYPFMLADVDFFIDFPDGSKGILECKTTNYNCQNKWANDSTPVNYEYQGRHYMAVMNIDKMYFACLYGNNENRPDRGGGIFLDRERGKRRGAALYGKARPCAGEHTKTLRAGGQGCRRGKT